MRSFDFIQTAPETDDCTAPYDIQFHKKITVWDFINEAFRQRECGRIYVYDPNNRENLYRQKDCLCEYNYFMIQHNFSVDILQKTIKSASANGGWARMDYVLTLEE